ncbi:MAG TPA: pyridoxamine 5'-phosphate oxidase family protein, partial [Patescibacteria group bacterium]
MLNISEQSRRSPKELKAEVLDFLQQHRVAVLSTLTPDNKPYAAPVIYAVDNSFHFYFFTRSDSKKYVGLAKDCLVSLVVYDEQEPQVVQTEGCASLEEDEQAIKEMSAELIKISMDSSPW